MAPPKTKKTSKATIKFLKAVVEPKYYENVERGELISENMIIVQSDVNLTQTDLSTYKKFFDEDAYVALTAVKQNQVNQTASEPAPAELIQTRSQRIVKTTQRQSYIYAPLKKK
jgi:hypothetical protein